MWFPRNAGTMQAQYASWPLNRFPPWHSGDVEVWTVSTTVQIPNSSSRYEDSVSGKAGSQHAAIRGAIPRLSRRRRPSRRNICRVLRSMLETHGTDAKFPQTFHTEGKSGWEAFDGESID